MTEQLITEIQRKMLPYLNNEQLMHLRDAMAETLEGATITYDSGSIPAEETDAVEAFITAKRIEGCSEKTLSYYRKTIESLIAGVGKAVQQVATSTSMSANVWLSARVIKNDWSTSTQGRRSTFKTTLRADRMKTRLCLFP